MPRPYKIPLGTVGVTLMCIPPSALLCVVLAIASLKVMIVSITAVVIGFLFYPGLGYLKKKNWMRFSSSPSLPENLDQRDVAAYANQHVEGAAELLLGYVE
jgi:hypothetical protein